MFSMRARQLLERSGPLYGPETTAAVNLAFERAWLGVGAQFTGDSYAVDRARLKLAECILAVTRDGTSDADQIERLALQMFRIAA